MVAELLKGGCSYDFFSIIERDIELLNPSSPEKLERLAKYCHLKEGDRVLDIASGKGYGQDSIRNGQFLLRALDPKNRYADSLKGNASTTHYAVVCRADFLF